jgi:hypothetical protein
LGFPVLLTSVTGTPQTEQFLTKTLKQKINIREGKTRIQRKRERERKRESVCVCGYNRKVYGEEDE